MLFKDKKQHRSTGDAHRARAEWPLAAEAYRRHLEDEPDDAAIWVQLGHAEKEDERFAAAEDAYRAAARLAPRDPDPLLHLSHLLKRHGQPGEAFAAFRQLLRLDPSETTMLELEFQFATRERRSQTTTTLPGSMVFPIEDMFGSFAAFVTFTGIQRVQASAIVAALEDPGCDAHFVLSEDQGHTPGFLRIDDGSLRAIVDYARGDTVDHQALRRLLAEARLTAQPITIGPDSWIVILGAFWGLDNRIERFLKAIRNGARIVLYVHDLIPVTHADHCEPHLSNAFWRALADYLQIVDQVMTNSDYTGHELARFIAAYHARSMPMQTVPLAHAVSDAAERRETWPAALARVQKGRYVAYVSTIEGRKNHLLVVQAWQRLMADGIDVPDLVFVGRMGWKIDPLTELLEETHNLDGRIHIVANLSDAELNAVYANASFTVFASFAEGWGLPVGESLWHGVPCVASRTSSLPEVGGDLVDYIDPTDLAGTVAVLRRLMTDDGYRAERRRHIRERFVPRSWAQVGADLLGKLKALIAAPPPPHDLPMLRLASGRPFWPGAVMASAEPVGDYVANPAGLALAGAFYEAETIGAWMIGTSGEFTFQTDVAPGETIVLMLVLTAAAWAEAQDCYVAIASAAGPPRALKLMTGRNPIRIEGPVAADGSCTVTIAYDGAAVHPPGETRSFVVALNAVGYCRVNDPAARANIREDLVFS